MITLDKKNWIIIIAEALIFLLIFGVFGNYALNKIERLEHNIDACKDTIEYVELKNGELIAMKESLIMSESEAREELDLTKEEMKDLKKKLDSDIAYIAKLESQIALKDTILMKPDTVVVKDGISIKTFNWENTWTTLNASVEGESIIDSKLSINNLKMDVPIELGLSDNYTFWIKSTNPYVTFTNVNSSVINNSSVKAREKHFHHGVYVGFGFQRGLFGKSWDFGPQFGYGFTYAF